MTPQEFTYWLQGYSEIAGKRPSKEQWLVIQDHLKLVFDKKTPERETYIDRETTRRLLEGVRPMRPDTTKVIC